VVAVTSLLPFPQAGGGVSAAHSVRARLLAAIDAARGDILVEQDRPSGPHTGSGYGLTYPWYPRPGHQVRIHTLGWAADGRLFQDAEFIFTMPAGHGTPAMNPIDGDADLTVMGIFFAVFPARRAWGKWHHTNKTLGLSADAAGIRYQLANGQFKIIRRGVVDGHKAIELGIEPGETTPRHPGGLPPDLAAARPAASQVNRWPGRGRDTASESIMPNACQNIGTSRHLGRSTASRVRSDAKPSAQPALVRTQHLPLPAETAPGLGISGLAGRLPVVSLCVMVCRCGPLHGSGYRTYGGRNRAGASGSPDRLLLDFGARRRR